MARKQRGQDNGERTVRTQGTRNRKNYEVCNIRRLRRLNRAGAAAVSSPFFTMVIQDEWSVSFDYAIVIHSIHSMLKNSIHSIQ